MAALFLKSTTRLATGKKNVGNFSTLHSAVLGSLKKNWSFPVMKLVNFQGSIEMKRDEN